MCCELLFFNLLPVCLNLDCMNLIKYIFFAFALEDGRGGLLDGGFILEIVNICGLFELRLRMLPSPYLVESE